jgi:hypothetical protein
MLRQRYRLVQRRFGLIDMGNALDGSQFCLSEARQATLHSARIGKRVAALSVVALKARLTDGEDSQTTLEFHQAS